MKSIYICLIFYINCVSNLIFFFKDDINRKKDDFIYHFLDLSRMTFWSRYDPIRHVQGNTDHWAKNRQQVRPPKLTQARICFFLANIFYEN